MNRFFRKYILHKYSKQISSLAERPLLIISDNKELSTRLIERLNEKKSFLIAKDEAPFLKQIGKLTYDYFIGEEKELYQRSSRFKSDKLKENLRKLCIKNTMGNNYGFDINPLNHNAGKRLKRDMTNYRWGARVRLDKQSYEGLCVLFPYMKVLCLNNDAYPFLVGMDNVLDISSSDGEKVLSAIDNFLA